MIELVATVFAAVGLGALLKHAIDDWQFRRNVDRCSQWMPDDDEWLSPPRPASGNRQRRPLA